MEEEIKVEEPVVQETKKETEGESRYKNDLVRFKKEARESQEAVQKLQDQLKSQESQALEEKSNYKELWEREKEKSVTLETKIGDFQGAFLEDKKRSAIEREAIKLGIKSNYMKFVLADAGDNVEVETTSAGNINILGAKEYVEQFKEKNIDLFKNENAPYINNARPEHNKGAKLSPMEIVRLQKTDPQAYKEYFNKHYR